MPRSAPGPGPGRPAKPRSWKVRPAAAQAEAKADPDATARPRAPLIETAAERDRRERAALEFGHPDAASYGLGDCLLYPLLDGPGVALLLVLPLFLWVMSIPVFDLVAALAPRGEFSALALLVVPLTLPLVSSFVLSLAYVALFLGHVLVASALGESDHPSWPEWEAQHLVEGLGRLAWGAFVGLGLGLLPAVIYWANWGEEGPVNQTVLALLLAAGGGYALLALAASLLHDNLLAANPLTVARAVYRIGWSYLYPWLVAGLGVVLAGSILYVVLFNSATLTLAAVGLWGFWLLSIYLAMVAARVLGLTYHRHAAALHWCRSRPAWATSSRTGRIYANS